MEKRFWFEPEMPSESRVCVPESAVVLPMTAIESGAAVNIAPDRSR
jgi:hypothetical protein